MTPEKKNVPDFPTKNKNIEIFSMPGLSVNLQQREGMTVKLTAQGTLKSACIPVLKKMNSRLQEEKPALVQEDSFIPSAWLPPIRTCF